jgi:hypothetical protein
MELGKGGRRRKSGIRVLVLPFERALDLKFPRRGTWHIRSNNFPENELGLKIPVDIFSGAVRSAQDDSRKGETLRSVAFSWCNTVTCDSVERPLVLRAAC